MRDPAEMELTLMTPFVAWVVPYEARQAAPQPGQRDRNKRGVHIPLSQGEPIETSMR